MNVLQVHEFYQQTGGEDQVVAAEERLLTDRNHHVRQHFVHNDRVGEYGRLELAKATVWNAVSYQAIRDELRQHPADVMHVHNTLPLLSPAIYHAAHAEGVAVVQTLHNYRLICPAATLFRDGEPCEACVGKTFAWPSVVHACYRGSRAANLAVAAMSTFHHLRGTWQDRVDVYIALTEFARSTFVRAGFAADRIVVKPNFVDLERPGAVSTREAFALFVGRLTPEKGIATLLAAWQNIGLRLPLKIVGDGPMRAEVARAVNDRSGVEWLGQRPRGDVLELMRTATVLVFPSTWYEGFPVTLAEAFASGLPVIASDLGSMATIVSDGRTGRTFPPGDAAALADRVRWVLAESATLDAMRAEVRREYEERYAPESNYRQLMEIYARAIDT